MEIIRQLDAPIALTVVEKPQVAIGLGGGARAVLYSVEKGKIPASTEVDDPCSTHGIHCIGRAIFALSAQNPLFNYVISVGKFPFCAVSLVLSDLQTICGPAMFYKHCR
jgi:hypothetical protein